MRLLKGDSGVLEQHKTWHQLESKTFTLLTNTFALSSLEQFPALRKMCCWKFSLLLQVFSLFRLHRMTSRSQVPYFGRGVWTTLTTPIATCYLMLQFIILYIPEGLGLVPTLSLDLCYIWTANSFFSTLTLINNKWSVAFSVGPQSCDGHWTLQNLLLSWAEFTISVLHQYGP